MSWRRGKVEVKGKSQEIHLIPIKIDVYRQRYAEEVQVLKTGDYGKEMKIAGGLTASRSIGVLALPAQSN